MFRPMTKFRTYLKNTEQTLGSFAGRVGPTGISPSYLSEIASGKKTPSLETARDITIASGKAIGPFYWLDELPGELQAEAEVGERVPPDNSHIATGLAKVNQEEPNNA